MSGRGRRAVGAREGAGGRGRRVRSSAPRRRSSQTAVDPDLEPATGRWAGVLARRDEVLDRWRENGFRGLSLRERATTAVAVVVVATLVVTLLVGVIGGITGPEANAQLADDGPSATTRDETAIVVAARAVSRMLNSDPESRKAAYLEDVDPDSTLEMQSAFETGVETVLKPYPGAADSGGPTLATQPLGYRISTNDGRLMALQLWVRREITQTEAPAPAPSFQTLDLLMRWNGDRWLLYAYGGSGNGPEPGSKAATGFRLLPGADPG